MSNRSRGLFAVGASVPSSCAVARKSTGQIRKTTGRRKGVAAEGPVTIGVPLVDPDWYVMVERGSRAGERFPLVSRLTIGRNDDNVLVLEDDLVSRKHAVLERHGGRYLVRDLGSRAGTLLNGEHVTDTAALVNGDEITLGATCLRVVGPPDPTTIDHATVARHAASAKSAHSAGASAKDGHATIICAQCGRKVRTSDRFCGSCGFKRE